jgi:integrase
VATPKTGRVRRVGLSTDLRDVLREHRQNLLREQHAGLAAGWVFPTYGKRPKGSRVGTPRPVALRHPSCLHKSLRKLLKLAEVKHHVTVHGLRRTHIDVLREAGVDPAVEHATVGHSSHRMREHYSTIRDDERRRAAEAVAQRLVPQRELNGS